MLFFFFSPPPLSLRHASITSAGGTTTRVCIIIEDRHTSAPSPLIVPAPRLSLVDGAAGLPIQFLTRDTERVLSCRKANTTQVWRKVARGSRQNHACRCPSWLASCAARVPQHVLNITPGGLHRPLCLCLSAVRDVGMSPSKPGHRPRSPFRRAAAWTRDSLHWALGAAFWSPFRCYRAHCSSRRPCGPRAPSARSRAEVPWTRTHASHPRSAEAYFDERQLLVLSCQNDSGMTYSTTCRAGGASVVK